ncbi:hypothetical protein TNCV_198881 [Trichonephila clavipes]|nr:hypothetical protein TNCV_198881 [Trichonephila clavipes]
MPKFTGLIRRKSVDFHDAENQQCLCRMTGGRSGPAPVNRLGGTSCRRPQRDTAAGVSAADKEYQVYPLDPRPDTVALYSGCTPGKRRDWFLPDDQHTASLVGLRGGWRPIFLDFTCQYHSNIKSLNTSYGVITELLNLLSTTEAGDPRRIFSDQGVIQALS